MKKSILNLGKTLNKTEQKNINGGSLAGCMSNCSKIYSGNDVFQCEYDCSIAHGGMF